MGRWVLLLLLLLLPPLLLPTLVVLMMDGGEWRFGGTYQHCFAAGHQVVRELHPEARVPGDGAARVEDAVGCFCGQRPGRAVAFGCVGWMS